MASGRYIWAGGVMNNGISCPAGTDTLVNSGAITLPNLDAATGNYVVSQSLAMPIRFTDTSVPTKITCKLVVTINTVGGTQVGNDAIYIIANDVLSHYSTNGMLYVQQFVNNPTSSWTNDSLGFAQIMSLTKNTRYVFALYVNPLTYAVTIDGASNASGFQTVYLDACGPFTDSTYPKDDGNGGIEY